MSLLSDSQPARKPRRTARRAYALVERLSRTVGAVLAGRRPRHPVGWALPAATWVAMYYPATALAAFACLGLVLLLVPTGSPPSPRWRWWAWFAAGAPAVLLLAMPLAPRPPDWRYHAVDNPLDLRPFDGALLLANRAALAVAVLGVLVGSGSLVVRFRRARGTERQQLRWVVLAAALTGVGMLASVVLVAAGNQVLVGWVAGACVAVLPLAIGAAVLRYRLFDLDRIISRTLAYGLLSIILGLGYAGVVLGLGQLLGRDSSLVVAAATLAVAALFQPARRRVQAVVDRRFDRRRQDDRGVQRAAAPAGRPGHADHGAADGGRSDHAADDGVAVAAAAGGALLAAVGH